MKKARLVFCAVALAAFAWLAVSCAAMNAGIQAGKDAANLVTIGQVWTNYCNTNKKGPANADDLMKSATSQSEKDAVQQIKDGHFQAQWNVNINDASAGGSGSMLVWTSAANNGVYVALMADGHTTATLQEAEFKNKPKAKPSTGLPK
jgi:hypothetical protein